MWSEPDGLELQSMRAGRWAHRGGLGKLAKVPGTFHLAVPAQDLEEVSPCVHPLTGKFRFPTALGFSQL